MSGFRTVGNRQQRGNSIALLAGSQHLYRPNPPISSAPCPGPRKTKQATFKNSAIKLLGFISQKGSANANPLDFRGLQLVDPKLIDRAERRSRWLLIDLVNHKAIIRV